MFPELVVVRFGWYFRWDFRVAEGGAGDGGIGDGGGVCGARFSNLYGDPDAWRVEKNAVYTVMSFLNCEKYPASLLYLLMTPGPSITIVGLVEWWRREGARALPAITRPVVFVGTGADVLLPGACLSGACRRGAGGGVLVAGLHRACKWFTGENSRR